MERTALELLLHSLDNQMTSIEQAQLKAALANSEALQEEQEDLLYMRELLAELRVERDSAFVEGVMEKLRVEKEPGFWGDIISLSPKVAAACVLFIMITLLSVYFWEGRLNTDVIIGVESLTPEDAYSIQEQKHHKKEKETAPFEVPGKRKNEVVK